MYGCAWKKAWLWAKDADLKTWTLRMPVPQDRFRSCKHL